MLYQRMNNGFYTDIINSTDEWAKIYAYRVADVTEDRNVNSIDANALLNIMPTPYYESLPTTVSDSMATFDPDTAVRQPVATVPPEKSTLTLDYLGTASKPLDKPQTPNLTADNVYDVDNAGSGIVWFGISIKNTQNLKYFLERIMPVCNKYDIKMAIHPDDPAWSVFGLPRIIINKQNILRMMKMVDDVHNGVTFCSGSYGTNLENDLPDMIRSLKGRIHFAHVRNLQHNFPGDFEESAHLSSDGSFDMYEIMKALYDIDFTGPIRPDHGRMIWGEVAMPGYGLYDRALGATYLNGLWEAIVKGEARHGIK